MGFNSGFKGLKSFVMYRNLQSRNTAIGITTSFCFQYRSTWPSTRHSGVYPHWSAPPSMPHSFYEHSDMTSSSFRRALLTVNITGNKKGNVRIT